MKYLQKYMKIDLKQLKLEKLSGMYSMHWGSILSLFNFIFLFWGGMVMYDNKFETKKNKIKQG